MKTSNLSLVFFAVLASQVAAQTTETSEPVRQPQPAAYISMTNIGGAFDFNEDAWRAAVARAGVRIYWKIDRNNEMAVRVKEVAASVDDNPPFAALYAINLRPDQAKDFDVLLDGLTQAAAGEQFAGSEFVMSEPLCRLLRLPEKFGNGMREHYLATIDTPDDQRTCYATMIAHVLANPDDFQPPPLEQIVVDGAAVMTQAVLPPVAVKDERFIEFETWKNDRKAVPRSGDAIFGPGEMIMLNVILENVGRDMVGTPLATYEVKLDIELRDTDDNLIAQQDDAMRFTGSAIHSVPIRFDYFETGVVTAFPLDEPGEYQIVYRLTDLNRPKNTAVVEVIKQVTIR